MPSVCRPVRLSASRVAGLLVAAGLGLSTAAAPAARGQGMGGMAAPASPGQGLSQVPADALVVLKVNHLDDTNAKASALLQQLGIVDLVPQAKDPLKAFEDATGIPPAALDGKRDAVVFMPNVAIKDQDEDEEAPPVVVLLPVADYKALTAAMTGAKTDGEVTTGRFKDSESDAFVAHWGDYAAITPRKALLAGKHGGLSVSGPAARDMDQKDVCLFANFPVLAKAIGPKLDEQKKKITTQLGDNMADADAAKKQLAMAALDQAFMVATSFLRDAQPTTVGLSIGKAGVSADMVVAFTPGSYLGDLFGRMKTTDGPVLGGLPDEKYLLFGGSVSDPAMTAKLMNDLLAPIAPKLSALGEGGTKLQSLLDLYKQVAATSEGGAFGMIVPTAALGQGSLVRTVTIMKADAQKMVDAAEQMADVQASLMASFGVKGADMMKASVTKDVKTVDGVHFDQIKSEVNPNAKNGQAAQAQQIMQYVYGPDGQTALIGAADPHTVVNTMGIDGQLLDSVVAAAKSNKDVLSAQVKAVDAELPKTRAAAAYLDLAQFLSTGLSYAHANGFNLPVQLPPNLPPIGMTVGTDPDGAALRVDGFVPTSLMQSMIQAGFQIYLNVPHGGGGM